MFSGKCFGEREGQQILPYVKGRDSSDGHWAHKLAKKRSVGMW